MARCAIERADYVVYHQLRPANPSHGGVALLIHKLVSAELDSWPEAEAWSSESEVVTVKITPQVGDPFRVSSWYVHGASEDTDGFARVLATRPDDMILLGDLNARIANVGRTTSACHATVRGDHLAEHLHVTGAMYPTPSGPTRPDTAQTADGGKVFLDSGTVIDHIVVPQMIMRNAIAADMDATVLAGEHWPSDHRPLLWQVELRDALAPESQQKWCRLVNWVRILPTHRISFNNKFRHVLSRYASRRDLSVARVEEALLQASRWCLPHTRPGQWKPTFYEDRVRDRLAEVAKGNQANVALMTATLAEERRRVLAERAEVGRLPSDAWRFVWRFYNFKKRGTNCPPLKLAGDEQAVGSEQRVHALAEHYQRVQADPPGSAIAAQQMLADRKRHLQDGILRDRLSGCVHQPWCLVAVTELRAAIAEFASGKCADPLDLRAEHLKLLDDSSLEQLRPFLDRALSHGIVPTHWKTAVTTPVPKPHRDLTLLKSWRPISVTPVLCRLCESVIHARIAHMLEQPLGGCGAGSRRLAESQFGFRRGVGTALPLTGLSMFIRDGLKQSKSIELWDARNPAEWAIPEQQRGTGTRAANHDTRHNIRNHCTLLVSIDASDAFCRALPAVAVKRIEALGLPHAARWVAELLSDRSFQVKERGVRSSRFSVSRGVPQGSILGPLLWTLVIDDLILSCQRQCGLLTAGSVAVPIIFADDINFAIRGFNPSSCVEKANALLAEVNTWSKANDIPMSKLRALWINGSTHGTDGDQWTSKWTAQQGKIVCGDLSCVPSTEPLKLLGVTFDHQFNFGAHVDELAQAVQRGLNMLRGMTSVMSAEKMAHLYEGLVLSKLRYAADCWYPFCSAQDRLRLERLHSEGCRLVIGAIDSAHSDSVKCEAGFRRLSDIVRDDIIQLGEKLRTHRTIEPRRLHFGPAWVAALFRDLPMFTARPRERRRADGTVTDHPAPVFPLLRGMELPFDTQEHLSLRDVARDATLGDPEIDAAGRGAVTQVWYPRGAPYPLPPSELLYFDTHVRFISSPPGGLRKMKAPVSEWTAAEKEPFIRANAERMAELRKIAPDAVYLFVDACVMLHNGVKKTAAAFVISRAQEISDATWVIAGNAPLGRFASIYAAELSALNGGLLYVRSHCKELFAESSPRHLVVVSDSKSVLEALQVTWVRRMDDREQQASRVLLALAHEDITTTLAFVFSHLGVAGNDEADYQALQAAEKRGERKHPLLKWWWVDTARHRRNAHHMVVDERNASGDAGVAHFRAQHIPSSHGSGPRVKRMEGLSRPQEILLFRARLGIFTPTGNLLPSMPAAECPLCGAPEAIGRAGTSITHLLTACAALPKKDTAILWTSPIEAAVHLQSLKVLVETREREQRSCSTVCVESAC
jgi:ribonuclease HI